MNPTWRRAAVIVGMTAALGALACSEHAGITDSPMFAKGQPGPPNGGEEAGNNLSFPVIWAEGETKTLPGEFEVEVLNGEWWYSWGSAGSDPNVVPMSCAPDPDEEAYCDDGIALQYDETLVPGLTDGYPDPLNVLPLAKAFVQKDEDNTWQAYSATAADALVETNGDLYVDVIDWGDNLESVDWYTKSQVRTEVVLFQANPGAVTWTEYEMRHVSGWGIDEVHGLAADFSPMPVASLGPGDTATVYSPCARFTIQKLLVERDDADLVNLIWVPGANGGWIEDPDYQGADLINEPIFNKAVHEAGDGPGYYNAEINVKGRIIYGYTWSVQKLNEGEGDYRLTFSFDATCGGTTELNTFFVDGVTTIRQPAEEVAAEEEPGGGAVGVLDYANNLTYMDVRILQRGGGGGGGGGKGGGGGGGPGGPPN